ncbi:MAG: AMP-binding protein [Eubacterium sp.]|nr:AMP-binding protein [Eubacterium sp.]
MNKVKYDGMEHPVREVTDLKDILVSSCEMFKDNTAFLEKDKPGGTYQPVTYAKIKDDMDALGSRFIEMGLKGSKIAVVGETSYLWFLTYFATVCGTGVIVPLDKNLPKDELKNLIKRSHVEAIVYSRKMEKTISELFDNPGELKYFISMSDKEHGDKTLSIGKLIDEGNVLLREGFRDFVDAEINPDEMSTLLFTSGTTGKSKGVMLSHRNIASNVRDVSKRVMLEKDWVVLSILPVHHTYENTINWVTLYQGKTIAICEGIKYILKNMNEVHANCMVGVPLVFEKIFKGIMKQAEGRGEGEKVKNAIAVSRRMRLFNNRRLIRKLFKPIHQAFGGEMQLFIAGGAAMDPEITESFEAMGIPMIQGYGMTEYAPIIAVNQDNYSIAKSVGRPMPNALVRIDDADENGVGEVVVKGPSVMMGYFEDQEATDEVLKNGWLHTGDLGYLDSNDFLYLTGRKKTVIVTKGGKNIYPEEVEAVLKENELIKETIVHGVTDKNIGNVIVTADIQPNYELLEEKHGKMSSSDVYHFYRELIDEINKSFPPYKVIKRINIREEGFAMTTTGKVKRYGNFIEGETMKGSTEFLEKKTKDRKHANEVIENINKSKDPYLRYKTGRAITDIKQMFNSSVDLYGDRVAFRQKFKKGEKYTEITYKQAQVDVNALGTALINLGLKGKRVAIIGTTYYQWETAYLAVTGGVGLAVPLDKELGATELKNLIQDAEVSAVLYSKKFENIFEQIREDGDTKLEILVNLDAEDNRNSVLNKENAASLNGEESKVIYSWKQLIEDGKQHIALGDRQFLDAEILGEDPAVILYTSGTTGFAKGVLLSNTNIVDNLMMAPTILNVMPDDIFFSVLPVHHTYECTCAFLMPLYKGASIAFCEGLKYITKNLQEVRPTMLLGVPILIETLYKKIWKGAKSEGKDKKLKKLLKVNKATKKLRLNIAKRLAKDITDVFGGRLRVLISGGAAIDPAILQFFNDLGIIAVQGYGLTECSPMAALNPDVERDMRNSSVGHLLPGMKVKIEDADEDGIGEICLKGTNVMLGYYNNDEATNEVIKNGWFHTGDLGYVDSEDFIYITGRKKNVIITENGKNVFPEELEYELSHIPYIAESMVWGDDTANEGVNSTTIVATVLLDEEEVEEAIGAGYTDEQVKKLIWDEIDKINARLPLFKKIKKLNIRKDGFDKTTGMKIKRFVEANKNI